MTYFLCWERSSTKTTMENSTDLINLPMEISNQQNSIGDTPKRNLQFLKLLSISNNIRVYTAMSFIPIGLLLNLLTVVLFLKIKIHKTSTGLHLLCLAVSEFFLLLGFSMGLPWPLRIKHFHVSFCMIMNFFISSQQTWAGFLLVSMTIERYLSISFPLKVKSWNLRRISKVLILTFATLSCVLGGLHAPSWIVDKKTHQCKINHNFQELIDLSNTFIVLGFGLCPILTFVFTVLIAHELYKQKKARNTLVQEGQTNNNDSKEFIISLMLFLVACMFLASKVVQVTIWLVREYSHQNSLQFQHAFVAMHYAKLLMILNHSANSLIYIIFFPKFREAFLSLLCLNRTALKDRSQTSTGGSRQSRQTISFSDMVQGTSGKMSLEETPAEHHM